jgi:hypothetical protein
MALHPIGYACHRSGLSPDAIRVWERRYGAVRPQRGEGGHRLYSDTDVERLRLLAEAVRNGHSIRLLAGLSDEEVGRLGGPPATSTTTLTTDGGQGFVQVAVEAALRLDGPALLSTLERAALRLGRVELIETVLAPLLARLGEAWERGEATPAHEHLASAVVRNFMAGGRWSASAPAGAPRLLVTTPAGERHELAAWLVAATATAFGWEVVWLGPDLPAADIELVARTVGARAVALSLTVPREEAANEVAALRGALQGVPLLVGGRGAAALARVELAGATFVGSLGELPEMLEKIAAGALPPPGRPRRR